MGIQVAFVEVVAESETVVLVRSGSSPRRAASALCEQDAPDIVRASNSMHSREGLVNVTCHVQRVVVTVADKSQAGHDTTHPASASRN